MGPRKSLTNEDVNLTESKSTPTSVEIAPIHGVQQVELSTYNLFRMASWLLLFFTQYDKNKEGAWLGAAFSPVLLVSLSALIAIIKLCQYANFQSAPLSEELKRNPKELEDVSLEEEKPFSFTYRISTNTSEENEESIALEIPDTVNLTVGENTLHDHALQLKTILESYGSHIDLPSSFSRTRKMLPFLAADMVCKGRVLEFFMFPGYLAGNSLGALLDISSPYNTALACTFSAISWAMALRESYILNDHKLKLNLEGFSFKDPSWCSCLPTCIGMQMRRQILFYPENENFYSTAVAVAEGEKTLKNLLADESKQTVDTSALLREFSFLIQQTSVVTSTATKTFNIHITEEESKQPVTPTPIHAKKKK